MSKQHRTIIVILSSAIALVAFMRLHLAITRAFDPDEFAYLHWTWLVANGYLPYRDFFFYIMPGLQWILSPLLWATGDSTNFLIGSRVFMFIVYGLSAAIVYRLSHGSLLAVLIFLTFPVTIDKTIDVRPDMVMLAFYFGSMLVKNSFLSGILFGLSFLVFPKIVFALPALLYLRRPNAKWLVGAAFVGLGFFAYLAAYGLIPQAITNITKDSFAVTSGKLSFSPLLLLTPYPLIYLASGGPNLPWAVNTGVWILGFAGLVLLLKHKPEMGIFWALFTAGNILFVILFPAPYVQYFLPLSIAGSVLAGYAIRKSINSIKVITMIIVICSFFLQYQERTAPGAENAEQLQVIGDVLRVTRPDESVYDMVGSYVFRPDGYFICCHPYAEFGQRLASRPGLERELRKSLIAKQTKFLVMDRVGFVFWQSPEPDKSFLHSNYLPTRYNKIYSLGVQFRCQNGACVQYRFDDKPAANRSTNVFPILIPETYTVTLEPKGETITIDGQAVQNSQTIRFSAGTHRFSASPTLSSLRIQLSR